MVLAIFFLQKSSVFLFFRGVAPEVDGWDGPPNNSKDGPQGLQRKRPDKDLIKTWFLYPLLMTNIAMEAMAHL